MRNWIIILLSILAFQACVDQQFDEPPFGEIIADAPEVTNTIAELKAMHITGTYPVIDQDIVVRGIVVANDETGNIYKKLIIQDESGGIELNINGVELSNSFPEGREIFIKCNGLITGDYAGVIGLGGAQGFTASGNPRINGIEESLLNQFVVKGSKENTVSPSLKGISDLGTADISTLIQIDAVEFQESELGQTFSSDMDDTNRYLQDCNGETILIRTSSFSDFINETLPEGNGTLTAVYNIFNTTKQLTIRRPSELAFTGPRCDGSGSGNGGGIDPVDLPEATLTLAELKASHTFGTYTDIPTDQIIKGIITADDASGNFFKKIIVQDGSAGIEVLVNERDLAVNYGLEIGREIAILCDGLKLGDFAGNISIGGNTFVNNSGNEQLGGIEPENIAASILIGEANMTVAPTAKNINDLSATDIHSFIEIEALQFPDGSTGQTLANSDNSKNLDLEDCDGNIIVIRTSNFADFSDALSPDGNGKIQAIYSVFNDTKQLFIRNTSDLNMTGERCDGSGNGGGNPGAELFKLDFEGLTSDQVIDVQGWTNFAEEGSLSNSWFVNDFDGNTYGEVTAFQSSDNNNISWLVTPQIEVSTTASFSFLMGQHHWAQDNGMQVMISDNFSGDPSQATWTAVNCTLPTEDNDWYELVESGNISISDYFGSGSVHIGFRYEGNANNATTSFIIDDIIATE